MDSEKITHLEMLLTYQERQIQDLSDMLNLHRKEIDMLKMRLDRTQKKLLDMENGAEGQMEPLSVAELAARDKPPHY